jgi:1-acyl-sn-glycerol-3-phosphate acyltransferase
MLRVFRIIFRLSGFLVLTITLGPIQFISLFVSRPIARWLPVYYFRALLVLLGVRVETAGDHASGGTLLVCNHISWLDILVLGSIRPVHYVAKKEVEGWPLFGQLAKLNRTLFIDRQRRHQAAEHSNAISNRLQGGDCLVLFPEGTSSDGLRVLPFKSALFSAVMPEPGLTSFPIQPVSMVYGKMHGIAMGRRQRSEFGWYGDTELLPHLLRVAGSPPFTVQLYYHTVPVLDQIAHRKDLAKYCETLTRDGIQQLLRSGLAPQAETR